MGAGWAQDEVARAIDKVMGTEKRDERQPHERLKENSTLFETIAAWLDLQEVDEPLRPKLLQHILREAIEKEAEDNRDARSASELLGFTHYTPDEIDAILAKEHSREIPKNSSDRRALLKPVRLLLAGTHQDPPIRMRTARTKQAKWADSAAAALYHYLLYLRSNPHEAALLKAKILLIQEAETGGDEQAEAAISGGAKKRRLMVATTVIVIATALVASGFLIKHYTNRETSSSSDTQQPLTPDEIKALEQRYDGEDPRGYGKYPRGQVANTTGKDSVCADKARMSEDLKENKPPLIGPDGKQVAVIELRRSTVAECRSVIWARVLWNGSPEATFTLPRDWTLHVVAHRPSTKTSFDFPEPEYERKNYDSPIPYALSPMMTTASGCAYVEAYFTNTDRRTVSASTSCVKI